MPESHFGLSQRLDASMDLLKRQAYAPTSMRGMISPTEYVVHHSWYCCTRSKMAIQLEYPSLVQIMEPQIVSECLRFCIAKLPLLFLPPETS